MRSHRDTGRPWLEEFAQSAIYVLVCTRCDVISETPISTKPRYRFKPVYQEVRTALATENKIFSSSLPSETSFCPYDSPKSLSTLEKPAAVIKPREYLSYFRNSWQTW